MKRYTVETHDNYDMEPDPNGIWVMFDDAQAAMSEAVSKARAWDAVVRIVEDAWNKPAGNRRDGVEFCAADLQSILRDPSP